MLSERPPTHRKTRNKQGLESCSVQDAIICTYAGEGQSDDFIISNSNLDELGSRRKYDESYAIHHKVCFLRPEYWTMLLRIPCFALTLIR